MTERMSDERLESMATTGVVKATPVGRELYEALVAERAELKRLTVLQGNTAAALDVAQEELSKR